MTTPIDVDDDGVTGLYAAGSSTFPVAGYANPTLTIVALALRLADHLADSPAQGSGAVALGTAHSSAGSSS